MSEDASAFLNEYDVQDYSQSQTDGRRDLSESRDAGRSVPSPVFGAFEAELACPSVFLTPARIAELEAELAERRQTSCDTMRTRLALDEMNELLAAVRLGRIDLQ